jgi:poly-gamma-glutamate synthesis protein (capsule biosynthesis protein)
MLTGSAVAAFIFGCLTEVALSPTPEPTLPLQQQSTVAPPWVAETAQQTPQDEVQVTPVVASTTPLAARPQDRTPVVNAALEPVAVIAHEQVSQPTDPTITLVFGGEVDLDELPYASLQEGELLAGVTAYQQADVAMVSLNNTLAIAATTLEEDFLDRQRPDAVALLKQGGVDIVDLAGEDTMAFGEQGLAETLETLDRNGVYRVGAGRDLREARRPEILDVKGQRIAYLSYNQRDLVRAYGDLGGINAFDKSVLIEDIRALRSEVDWLVVNYRWSEDLPDTPADWQTNLARMAIDQGADVVVGHHPTQVQGTEVYRGRPIAYSLGDFIFGEVPPEGPEASAVLQIALGDRQMKVDLLPVRVSNGRPQQVDGPEADAILQEIWEASQTFPEPMKPSMVLDLQPAVPAEAVPTGGDFITAPSDTAPLDNAPAEAIPLETAPTTETQTAAPRRDGRGAGEAPGSAPAQETMPPALEGSPHPGEVPFEGLEEWGPKESPGQERFVPIPEAGEPLTPLPAPATSSLPEAEVEVEIEATVPEGEEAIAPEPGRPRQSKPDAIAPYSEPIVGPLARRALEADAVVPEVADARARLGLPQTRVFKPLAQTRNPRAAQPPAATTLEARSPLP